MQQQEQQVNYGSENQEDPPLPGHECLKFHSANQTPVSGPIDDLAIESNDTENEITLTSADHASLDPSTYAPSADNRVDDHSIFGFARINYMNPLRSWTKGKVIEGYDPLPSMVRSISGSLSSSDTDDAMSSSSGGPDDDAAKVVSRGVTFNETVRVMPIPPLTAYTPEQRFRMYANRFELRENKLRNKKEYQFDGYDWRNATEECHMAICPKSGEILHPAHL